MGVFSQERISLVVLFRRIFCIQSRTLIFRYNSEHLHSFFSLTALCQTKIYFFCFFVSRPVLVSHKLELGTFLIIPGVFLKPSPAFQNTEATFGKCSAKEVVQQNDVMKCDSSILVARKRYMQIYKKCHTTTSMFQRILTKIQNSDIEKYISRTAF